MPKKSYFFFIKEPCIEKNTKIAETKLIINQINSISNPFYFTEMKTKKDLHKPAVGVYGEEGRSKKLVPEKKHKSNNRALIEELDEDEELEEIFDYKEKESIEDFFDDEEDFDDDDFDEDDFNEEDFDDEDFDDEDFDEYDDEE